MRAALALVALAIPTFAASRLMVTVVEPKTGVFVTGLGPADFTVLDDKTERKVESVEMTPPAPLDVMLLLDTSLVGAAVQPFASSLIGQLHDKDQMAVVGYHSSADLIQEFTSSRELLQRAIGQVRYGNTPRVLDALSAAIRDGFGGSVYRRVIVLLTTGFEGGSRESDRDVIKAAHRNGVSIYPVYMSGAERGLFETLARQTGGATFSLNELRKSGVREPGPRIFETVRQTYTLSVAGNLGSADRFKVQVRPPRKVFVSTVPLE